MSFRINDCFPSPFPSIPFSDLSWPELFCLLSWEHLEGRAPRCFILQSPAQSNACHSQPTATCKQVLTRTNLLTTEHGQTGMLQHFPGVVSCLPHKLFLGFVCNNNIIKIELFWASCSQRHSRSVANLPRTLRAEKRLKQKWGEASGCKGRTAACSASPVHSTGGFGRSVPG